MITQKYLMEAMDYDPETGIFTWKRRPDHHFASPGYARAWNAKWSGSQAGNINKTHGYYMVSFKNEKYLLHRLAWLYVYGRMPDLHIDHINSIRTDNRIDNLREVTRQENQKNTKLHSNNTSGYCGVYYHKVWGKWVAHIKDQGKHVHLGGFKDKEDAVKVRLQAEIQYGYHQNHGRK